MNFDFENSEDQKLATLAFATLVRANSKQAASLRDDTGRTYVAINIKSGTFELDALHAVLTVALSSQISKIESVVICGEVPKDVSVITDHSPGASIWYVSESDKKSL